jgi:hypothetical protein
MLAQDHLLHGDLGYSWKLSGDENPENFKILDKRWVGYGQPKRRPSSRQAILRQLGRPP